MSFRSRCGVNVTLKSRLTKRRRLVARERRAHHALVHEFEEGVARHARLLREDGDLGQRLRHHAEEHVVADLDDARELALADVARRRRDQLEQRRASSKAVFGPGADEGELARLDHLGVAGHRRGQVLDAVLLRGFRAARPILRAKSTSTRSTSLRLAPCPRQQRSPTTSFTSFQVDTMQNTMSRAGELGELVGDLRAVFRQRLGLVASCGSRPARRAALGEARRPSRSPCGRRRSSRSTVCHSIALVGIGNRQLLRGIQRNDLARPSGVSTTSSSMRAADTPSFAGQKVSTANTMPTLSSIGLDERIEARDQRPLVQPEPQAVAEIQAEGVHLGLEADLARPSGNVCATLSLPTCRACSSSIAPSIQSRAFL